MDSLELLKKEYKQVMSDLQKFPLEITDALNKCKQLAEENKSYNLELRDLTKRDRNVGESRLEDRKLWEEQTALQESCEEMKKLLRRPTRRSVTPAEQHQEQESPGERWKDLLQQQNKSVTQQRDLSDKTHCHFYISEKRTSGCSSVLPGVTGPEKGFIEDIRVIFDILGQSDAAHRMPVSTGEMVNLICNSLEFQDKYHSGSLLLGWNYGDQDVALNSFSSTKSVMPATMLPAVMIMD
ncbi:hypothetical protein STEG23_015936 [Scotinomys teguina]